VVVRLDWNFVGGGRHDGSMRMGGSHLSECSRNVVDLLGAYLVEGWDGGHWGRGHVSLVRQMGVSPMDGSWRGREVGGRFGCGGGGSVGDHLS